MIKFDEISQKSKKAFNDFAQHEDTQAAAKWTKEASIEAGKKAKAFSKTQLGKQMLFPAVLCALVAIPIPVIGPIIGALVGATWGYYNYMKKKDSID